jgi:hypothetical protein
LKATQTNYSLTVENETDCKDSATVNVFLSVDIPIYIPNVFSPHSVSNKDLFPLTP